MKEHFECPDCGPHVAADEDGCCSTCGKDTVVTTCECLKGKPHVMAGSGIIICPGCCWEGTPRDLGKHGQCPQCGYENGTEPYRLLTLVELLADTSAEYQNVRLGLFLGKTLARVTEELRDAGWGSVTDMLPRQLVLDQIANEPAYPDAEDFLRQLKPALLENELSVDLVANLLIQTARLAVEDTKRCLAAKITAFPKKQKEG